MYSTGISTGIKVIALIVVLIIAAAGIYFYVSSSQPQHQTIVVYGSVDAKDMQPLLSAFQGNYSYISVDYEQMIPPTLFTRVTSEVNANKSTADVVVVTQSIVYPLQRAGLLLPYNSSQLSNYPKEFHDPKGYWAAALLLPVVFCYNTNLVSKANLPKTIDEITNPVWKGKVIMHDITVGSTSTQYMLSLIPILGNSTWTNFVQSLAQNVHPALNPDIAAVAEGVARGEYSLGLVCYLHDVLRLKEQGAPIDYFLPQSIPILAAPSSVAIIKTTKNLKAAEIFEDFLLSKGAQQIIGNTPVRIPAMPGVNAKYTIEKLLPNVKIVLFPTSQVASSARAWADKFKQMGFG